MCGVLLLFQAYMCIFNLFLFKCFQDTFQTFRDLLPALNDNLFPTGNLCIDLIFLLLVLTPGIPEDVYKRQELNGNKIARSQYIANPGCFATAIELGLLPLAKDGLLPDQITIFGVTGSTGAGQRPTGETHYSNRAQNLSVYKAFTHQHLGERCV